MADNGITENMCKVKYDVAVRECTYSKFAKELHAKNKQEDTVYKD